MARTGAWQRSAWMGSRITSIQTGPIFPRCARSRRLIWHRTLAVSSVRHFPLLVVLWAAQPAGRLISLSVHWAPGLGRWLVTLSARRLPRTSILAFPDLKAQTQRHSPMTGARLLVKALARRLDNSVVLPSFVSSHLIGSG